MQIPKFNQTLQQLDYRSSLKRLKRSDDNLKLPENFEVGRAIADGNCFFDSFKQGLEQQLGIKVTVQQLREYCEEFAQNNPPQWFRDGIANSHDNSGMVRNETSGSYIINVLNSNRWGDPEVEGRILCEKYGVKLHIVEKLSYRLHLEQQILGDTRKFSEEIKSAITNSDSDQMLALHLQKIGSDEALKLLEDMTAFDGVSNVHQLFDFSGPLSLDSLDYNDEHIIHIVNGGRNHFEPVLSTQKIQHSKQQSSDFSGYDDNQSQTKPNEDLMDTIRGNDSEEEKLRKIENLLNEGADINFRDANHQHNTPLHAAVRKGNSKVVELLIIKRSKC